MKKETIIKCTCNCSAISVDKWEDEDLYYITTYKSVNKSFLYRLKEAVKYIFGCRIVDTDVILTKEEFNKLKNF